MKSDEEKIFVYSEMQIKEDNAANKSIGREFKCGRVYTGNNSILYSKIISEKELQAMVGRYPDTKIVYRGILSKTQYSNVSIDYIKGV